MRAELEAHLLVLPCPLMTEERDVEPARLPWLPLLPWQPDAARAALAQKSSWPHALLVHGPRGIGKHALALGFAQALLCEAPGPDGLACGVCPGCRYAARRASTRI